MRAFERAKLEGADGIELDVRLCASGEVVVFHDPGLARATDGRDPREVEALPLAELSAVRLFGGPERAPRLAEVLTLCRERDMMLNVEIKYDVRDKVALARAVARELSGYDGRLVISSFDPRLLWLVRAMGLRAPTALLTNEAQRYAMMCVRAFVRLPIAAGVHFERSQALPHRIARLRRRGLFCGAWTVNDPAEARSLSAAGVNWLITDAPATMVEALSAAP